MAPCHQQPTHPNHHALCDLPAPQGQPAGGAPGVPFWPRAPPKSAGAGRHLQASRTRAQVRCTPSPLGTLPGTTPACSHGPLLGVCIRASFGRGAAGVPRAVPEAPARATTMPSGASASFPTAKTSKPDPWRLRGCSRRQFWRSVDGGTSKRVEKSAKALREGRGTFSILLIQHLHQSMLFLLVLIQSNQNVILTAGKGRSPEGSRSRQPVCRYRFVGATAKIESSPGSSVVGPLQVYILKVWSSFKKSTRADFRIRPPSGPQSSRSRGLQEG